MMSLRTAIYRWLPMLAAGALMSACSSTPEEPISAAPAVDRSAPIQQTTSNHPYAQYIELAGFRLGELEPGTLEVRFAAINHSEAELGDVQLMVRLFTNVAGPDDPPVAEFNASIEDWASREVRDVTATTTTELRVYELPDWQFLRPEFEITSPAP